MARGYYYNDFTNDYPEDIAKLKEVIPEIRCFHDSVIDYLYSDFSTTWYCAGWMNLGNKPYIEEFRRYLLTDYQDATGLYEPQSQKNSAEGER